MKRLLASLLLLLLPAALLAGCDLRNRQDSEGFIPEQSGLIYPTGLPSGTASNDPLNPGEKNAIKTVLSYEGELPLTYPVETCSYELPMIDLSGAQAMGCNQEIELRYGTLIRQSIEAIERFETPTLASLSYTSYIYSDILTLRVDELDTDGNSSRAYYTVDANTGEAVSVERLFAAAGIPGTPQAVVSEGLMELFSKRFGSVSGADSSYTTALNQTQEALLPLTANRMHLSEDGRVVVALELFAPNGGSSVEELLLP